MGVGRLIAKVESARATRICEASSHSYAHLVCWLMRINREACGLKGGPRGCQCGGVVGHAHALGIQKFSFSKYCVYVQLAD